MGLYTNLTAPTGPANMRGAVDFSNAGAFTLAEKGHSLLAVLDTPKMMTAIKNSSNSQNLKNIIETFPKIIEQEFKGLDGLDGMTSNTLEVSDNISTLNMLGTVEYPTNQEITMRFTEKRGRTILKYCSTYLRAIRDPRTRAKTYLGCADKSLKGKPFKDTDTKICPSLANEVFTFLYIVPDNTWTSVENAYLLCNAQLTKAPFDALDNFDKGDISLVELDLSFNTFVITENKTVYKMAQEFLNSYVSIDTYQENKWNINSEKLQYSVFDNVYKNNKLNSTTAGGANLS